MADRHSSWYTQNRNSRARSFHLPSVHVPSLIELGIERDFDELQREYSSVRFFSFFDSNSSPRLSSYSVDHGANSLSNQSSQSSYRQATHARISKHRQSRSKGFSRWWGGGGISSSNTHRPLPQIPEACHWNSGASGSTAVLSPPLPPVEDSKDIDQLLENPDSRNDSVTTAVGDQSLSPKNASTRSYSPNPEPRATFVKMSSLDNILRYHRERAEWKRDQPPLPSSSSRETRSTDSSRTLHTSFIDRLSWTYHDGLVLQEDPNLPPKKRTHSIFRHPYAEYGFWFCICMTQFLTEFLLSGFAIELTRLSTSDNKNATRSTQQSAGKFWPASLLNLILSSMLLIWARLADMYGGYPVFMFGLIWLTIWCWIPGCSTDLYVLDISRAMQGLAIGAFAPSTIVMLGTLYAEGRRKTFVMGLWSGFAAIGFFAGFVVAGAVSQPKWYFWIPAIISAFTAVAAFLTIPVDETGRYRSQLKMDWLGAVLISTGLILVIYALSSEPYATQGPSVTSGWGSPRVAVTLALGATCLLFAFWVEGWVAACPLLPLDFFKYKHVKTLGLSCMCCYASYGVWLYYSAEYFEIAAMTDGGVKGIRLAMWYAPVAIGGLVFCVLGGTIMHAVPTMVLLITTALSWIGAPLFLALAPMNMSYWAWAFPSMVCAAIGINLTYAMCMVYFSATQPLEYQGLTGAVGGILFNLGISFALSVAEIVSRSAESTINVNSHNKYLGNTDLATKKSIWGYRAAFVYGASSAGLGLVICALFVRIRLVGAKRR